MNGFMLPGVWRNHHLLLAPLLRADITGEGNVLYMERRRALCGWGFLSCLHRHGST